jgi:hypothetical protein
MHPIRSAAAAAVAMLLVASSLAAQDHDHHHPAAAGEGWTWTTDGTVFVGFNDQERKFTDFRVVESQNWFMLDAAHPLGAGHLTFGGMLSLEPFTMEKLGSPQVFQTGESYQGAPLIDRQHPHDLLMGLGATFQVARGPFAYTFSADLVGSPALGPIPFMHRDSGRDNPQAPLSHHYMDSTHITPGVLTAGVESHGFGLEASWFRGEEPDDNRLDIDRPMLDSWSVRGSWRRGPWEAQFSGGHLHQPEWFELSDLPRLTASISYSGALGSHPLAATAAWGENREVHGILDGYLLEWDLGAGERGTFYGRAESVAKDLLDLGGPDPPGFIEFHRISHVAAFTAGYIYDVRRGLWGRLGLGADATAYHVPDNMLPYYGSSPLSFHLFVRWRPLFAHSASHMH